MSLIQEAIFVSKATVGNMEVTTFRKTDFRCTGCNKSGKKGVIMPRHSDGVSGLCSGSWKLPVASEDVHQIKVEIPQSA